MWRRECAICFLGKKNRDAVLGARGVKSTVMAVKGLVEFAKSKR